ncbi:glycosyltransferase [Lactonifactor sp. BIOML-A3]|uniref:glycosyltransferase family 2 protein n=1 Tax=unclassified Lactonifactor TaxID=2636670 RepID=UPI0012AFF87C|nr:MULTISPECIES: glycosyltransferase family 2 protein [unclassified Lactonifactor]MSA03911.1 glycosyltransferase [Lactonifactor sp. BIOML-A5]MSA10467.1 glycosyltransferase [Lactonifactor sp. BIOML-A4]MSA14970.1 glycosyltransferase [Lactonifactor sp. BIOML-A3]MSA19388.1 glycosyltransferase [Lactonifactor sp. BIOML-A2]MSA39968.1 glycosyltransferase [Lactonifactor sp. BIOML-A1]
MCQKLSIGIIAYNEEEFLPNLLNDMKAQKYPHEQMEILLIDSCSTDKTKEIMQQFRDDNLDFYSIQVLDNPKKIQAAGWNVAIQNYTGDVLARIDAHTKVMPEYSERVMKTIQDGEMVVGGIRPCVIEKDTSWANVLLQVENSLFGSSINSSRRSTEKTYVKTMFHAAYRREVLEKVGLFNEKLLRTEDNEFHYRIREAGYKLCYDPTIVSYQYARSDFKRMVKQKYGNGYWIGLTLKICPGCISIYHLVPVAFVLAIVITSIMSLFGMGQLAILMWAIYALFAVGNTVISGIQHRFYMASILMPFMFLVLHVSYGIGTCVGLASTVVNKE